MTYTSELLNKKYVYNVVIRFASTYFSMRQPDSGLTVGAAYVGLVDGLTLNPSKIDPRVSTTVIPQYQFKLLDRDSVISFFTKEYGQNLFGEPVEIWLGRTGVGMAFSDYFKLPITKIKKLEHSENAYMFTTAEETDRLQKPIYSQVTRNSVDILAATTIISGLDDISGFPASGLIKIEDEFFSYASKNDTTKTFSGVIRGENGSTPADHDANADMMLAETVTDNPLSIILKILTSGGGGSAYDVLDDGLAVDQSLVDITGIEALRDDKFSGQLFTLTLYDISNALKYIESEILMPNHLRFGYADASKLTLFKLNTPVFVEEVDQFDEDTIASFPKWTVDDNKIVNQIIVDWDFNEGTQEYQERSTYTDADSVTAYGARKPLKFEFKGFQEDEDGQDLVDVFANDLLTRLAIPSVEIDFSGHIDKSLVNPGEMTKLISSQVPNYLGELGFNGEVEVLSRGINHTTGLVAWKLGFTGFSVIRSGYIAPSDLVVSKISQKKITVASGRGAAYAVGYKMRLYNEVTDAYTADAVNTITDITGDTITFLNDFVTVLVPTTHRIKFADYDESVTDDQFAYCFISDDGNNFGDGERTYSITK